MRVTTLRSRDKSPRSSTTIAIMIIAITSFLVVACLSSAGIFTKTKGYHTAVLKEQSDDHSKKRGLRFALSKTIFLKENEDHLYKFVDEEHHGGKEDDEEMYSKEMVIFKKGNGGIFSSDNDRMTKKNGGENMKDEQLLVRFSEEEEVSSIRGPR